MPRKEDKGFFWFAIQGKTDYVRLSGLLADSIKRSGTQGKIAVAGDLESCERLEQLDSIDYVIPIHNIKIETGDTNFSNEPDVFGLTPFTHTIKLEADMLITQDLSWWWNILKQHDLVLSHGCLNHRQEPVIDREHRRLFKNNQLPNVYNGLTYFRYSETAFKFFKICKDICLCWHYVKDNMLINCHDQHPTTDVVYALALKILDPLQERTPRLDFFRMIHYKNHLNDTNNPTDMIAKHLPMQEKSKMTVGAYAITKPLHYHHRDFPDRIYHEQ